MGRALLVIVVAVCTCALILWLAAPRLLSPSTPAPPGSAPAAPPANASPPGSPLSSLPPITATGSPGSASGLPAIAPLVSPEQKAITDYEAQRAPLYAFLHDKCGSLVLDGRPSQDDRSLLVLYTARDDDHIVTDILTQIITPYAYAYGFRHVRFYLPNPPGGVERFRLAAEAQASAPNNWQAFQR